MANNRREGIESLRLDPSVDKHHFEKTSEYNHRQKIQKQIRNHTRNEERSDQ